MILDELNVTTENSQSSYTSDMSIKNANLCFENVRIIRMFEPEYYTSTAVLNEYIKTEEKVITENDYALYFELMNKAYETTILEGNVNLEYFGNQNNFYFSFSIYADRPVHDLNMIIEFDTVTVEWDKFDREAWYIRANKKDSCD